VRLFPACKYIYWVRNPRDNILARHLTDDLRDFGVTYPDPDEMLRLYDPADQLRAQHADAASFADGEPALDDLRLRMRRAISWQYQYEIVKATPKPAHWIVTRFEDFVRDQEGTLTRLEQFLGFPLARIPIRQESVGRYNADLGVSYFDFLASGMREFGYDIPP